MKKKNNLGLFVVLGIVFMSFTISVTFLASEPALEAQGNYAAVNQENQDEIVIKTYFLKYIEPDELLDAAKLYIRDVSAYKDSISVRIYRKHVPDFEALLKKLDVEKKTVQFKVYTVIASREEQEEKEVIANKDLKRVLDELESLWKFKSYTLDGPSFLTVKDGSGNNYFKLVSTTYNFNLRILHVSLKGEQGERIISVGQIQLRQRISAPSGSEQTLINTENVTLKEKGYLVAGVSGIGSSGKALILIINAEIK
jgi:hypothetical protein